MGWTRKVLTSFVLRGRGSPHREEGHLAGVAGSEALLCLGHIMSYIPRRCRARGGGPLLDRWLATPIVAGDDREEFIRQMLVSPGSPPWLVAGEEEVEQLFLARIRAAPRPPLRHELPHDD